MANKPRWYLYIIVTKADTLYTGISTDPKRRFEQHLNGTGAKYFRKNIPDKIVYIEEQTDRSSASKRECVIKKLTRSKKDVLVEDGKIQTAKLKVILEIEGD